jgi:hypothetical protein
MPQGQSQDTCRKNPASNAHRTTSTRRPAFAPRPVSKVGAIKDPLRAVQGSRAGVLAELPGGRGRRIPARMPPWTPSFGTYHAWTPDGSVVVVTVDKAAKAGIGQDHPVSFSFMVELQDPRDDGLLSDEERPRIDEFQEAVEVWLQRSDPWLVGSRTENSGRFYFYYLTEQRPSGALPKEWPHGYELQWHVELDPEWHEYEDSLAPTPFQEILIDSNTQCFEMGKLGDHPETERPVDHTVLFRHAAAATAGANALQKAGFTVISPSEAVVTATRTHDLTGAKLEQMIQSVLHAVEAHRGTYDGWGAPIQPSPPQTRRRGLFRR